MKWLSWLRRRPRASLSPPPAPTPGGLQRAREEVARTEVTLAALEAQRPVVEEVARRAEEIHRKNNLGPAFMAALGQHRRA